MKHFPFSVFSLMVGMWLGCSGAMAAPAAPKVSAGDAPAVVQADLHAAAAGKAEAQWRLAQRYAQGLGVAQDQVQAVRWSRAAAGQGVLAAQVALGRRYLAGQGVMKDSREATKWFREAADAGDAQAQERMGYLYQSGQGVVHDYAQAVAWYRKAADQNDGQAQAELAFLYMNGLGGPLDSRQALSLYRTSAEGGNALGQLNLGLLYLRGDGVEQDDKEAAHWFSAGARNGSAAAECNLSFMAHAGRGMAVDEQASLRWARQAAAHHDPLCEFAMGQRHLNGDGVKRDMVTARALFRASAGQGFGRAAGRLGRMLELGLGGPVDLPEALDWYRQGARNEDADSLEWMGDAYRVGRAGLPVNPVVAVAFYLYAQKRGGDQDSDLQALAANLPAGQQDQARRLAASPDSLTLMDAVADYLKG